MTQPSVPPGYAPPPIPPWGAPSPPRPTSALAIASLILSLVWLFGLGSVLAVVFAIVALARIGRSAGAQGGQGLAIAGLIVGIVGVVGAAFFWLLVAAFENIDREELRAFLAPQTQTVDAGQPVTLTSSPSGIRTMTVHSVTHPAPPPSEFFPAPTGKEFAVADVEACAGPAGSQTGVVGFFLELVFPGGEQVGPSLLGERKPSLFDIKALAPSQCGRGFVTFQITSGTSPVAVTYRTGVRTAVWRLPRRPS